MQKALDIRASTWRSPPGAPGRAGKRIMMKEGTAAHAPMALNNFAKVATRSCWLSANTGLSEEMVLGDYRIMSGMPGMRFAKGIEIGKTSFLKPWLKGVGRENG